MKTFLPLALLLAVTSTVGVVRVAEHHATTTTTSAAAPRAIWCVNSTTIWIKGKAYKTPTVCVPGP